MGNWRMHGDGAAREGGDGAVFRGGDRDRVASTKFTADSARERTQGNKVEDRPAIAFACDGVIAH